MSIQTFIEKTHVAFDPFVFESGQCHTFALAFKKRFGGELVAIMRHDAEDDLDWYSHMIVQIGNKCYDVNGDNADELWCERFSEDDDFDYQTIEVDDLVDFLKKWNCSIDNEVLSELDNL